MKSQLLYYVKSVQIQTRETSVFGYFSRTISDAFFQIFHIIICVFFCLQLDSNLILQGYFTSFIVITHFWPKSPFYTP